MRIIMSACICARVYVVILVVSECVVLLMRASVFRCACMHAVVCVTERDMYTTAVVNMPDRVYLSNKCADILSNNDKVS